MDGWTRMTRSEAVEKSRLRNRIPNQQRQQIEDEVKYLNDHPDESTRIQKLGELTFEEWFKKTRGTLLRISRAIKIPITVRPEEGNTGLYFWRSTPEELASRPNPQRRPTPEQKAMGVTEDLEEGADEDEIEEEESDAPVSTVGKGSRRKKS